MAAKSIRTNSAVYQALLDAYREKYGRSPSGLIGMLNEIFQDELTALRGRPRASPKRDLISDKTIRNFFKEDSTQALTEKNLNYLCRALLGADSYRDAITQSEQTQKKELDIGAWLKKYVLMLKRKHNAVRIPSMGEPTLLDEVYTESKLSEELQFRKNKSIAELQAEMEPGYKSNRSRSEVSVIFAKHSRLMLWGRAGSGKTTALKKYLLSKLNKFSTEVYGDLKIPVFVALRKFFIHTEGTQNLLETISFQIKLGGLEDTESKKLTLKLLKEGKLLILMDGLDEVPKDILPKVQQEISNLVASYPDNRFILTCRYGATEFVPSEFKEVEMTAFDSEQVEDFVVGWFKDSEEPCLDRRFLERLKENTQMQELAKNPLMLTMLCTLYKEGYDFPKGSSTLFDDATELYLRKWDSYRRIDHRDTIYDEKLSRNRRRNLFYKLAFDGMAQHEEPKYFWKKTELELFIKDFIGNLSDVKESSVDTDARAIINALEAQDSLLTRSSSDAYTFSYRSFQEYFAAMSIVESVGSDSDKLKALLEEHVLKEEWGQVFSFAAQRFSSADDFLIQLVKLSISEITKEERLVEIFDWWESITDRANIISGSWRACFLTFDLKTDLKISRKLEGIDEKRAQRISVALRQMNKKESSVILRTALSKLVFDLAVIHALVKDKADGRISDVEAVGMYDATYKKAQEDISEKFQESVAAAHELLPQLGKALRHLQNSLPTYDTSKEECDVWADKLRDEVNKTLYKECAGNESSDDFCDDDPIVVLNDSEIEALNNYLQMVELIVICLNSDIYCSKSLRKELVSSLILSPNSSKIPQRLLPDSFKKVAVAA